MCEGNEEQMPGRRRSGRKGLGERGQSLVEFSFVALLFFFLVFGVIDFGIGIHSWITVTNASREGARVAAVHAASSGATDCNPLPTAGSIERKVCDVAAGLDPDDFVISVTGADPGGIHSGDPVTVHVNYVYHLVTPLGNIMHLSTLTFTSSTQMRLE